MDSRKSLERGLNKSFTVEESATMGRRERRGEGNDENGEREGRFNADVANFLPSVHASLCLNLPPPPFPVAQDGPFRGVARENLCRMIVGASGSFIREEDCLLQRIERKRASKFEKLLRKCSF